MQAVLQGSTELSAHGLVEQNLAFACCVGQGGGMLQRLALVDRRMAQHEPGAQADVEIQGHVLLDRLQPFLQGAPQTARSLDGLIRVFEQGDKVAWARADDQTSGGCKAVPQTLRGALQESLGARFTQRPEHGVATRDLRVQGNAGCDCVIRRVASEHRGTDGSGEGDGVGPWVLAQHVNPAERVRILGPVAHVHLAHQIRAGLGVITVRGLLDPAGLLQCEGLGKDDDQGAIFVDGDEGDDLRCVEVRCTAQRDGPWRKAASGIDQQGIDLGKDGGWQERSAVHGV
ncbi:hypothetical protein THIX_60069 [Thiomonas sp. X19]|nr:hypothetical protein THIX_60069 [Thiomonas sp. X19]